MSEHRRSISADDQVAGAQESIDQMIGRWKELAEIRKQMVEWKIGTTGVDRVMADIFKVCNLADCSVRGSWIITIHDIMSSTDDDDVVSFRRPWGEGATVQLAYHDVSDTFSIIVNKVPLAQEGDYFLSLQGRQLRGILMYNWRSRKELRLETDDDYYYLRAFMVLNFLFCTEADLQLFVEYVNREHLISKWGDGSHSTEPEDW